MFKILTVGVLIYLLYRLVVGSSGLGQGDDPVQIKKEGGKKKDEDDYIDYEEVE